MCGASGALATPTIQVEKAVAWDAAVEKLTSKVHRAPQPLCSFDWSEAMESGMPSGLPHMPAWPRSDGKEERLVVNRTSELQAALVTSTGDALLTARASRDGRRFEIFTSRDGVPARGDQSKSVNELLPSFVLEAVDAERSMWALLSSRCSSCEAAGRARCGVSCIARMRHFMEATGAGDAYCMDVELPRGTGSFQASNSACAACQAAGCDVRWTKELSSRRPKWNFKDKTLMLNFRGRATQASAKNFQLEHPETHEPLLLFGKVGEQKFVLDYLAPLGMVQAFASALTTFHWV